MKKIFTLSTAFLIMLVIASSVSHAQNANVSLSNLVAPTAVNENLAPNKNNKLNLGSTNKNWKRLFITDGLYNYTMRIFGVDSVNTIVGFNSLAVNAGKFNTAIGSQALRSNGTGILNTSIGSSALLYNTSGNANTASGVDAMYSNTIGSFNTASGYFALALNKSGSNNTAFGNNSLYSNDAGHSNIGIGTNALYANTNTSNLVAIGDSSLMKNTSGVENTAVGSKTLSANVSGVYNTATGYMALTYNTSSYNTAIGAEALRNNFTGSGNTAHGALALSSMYSGIDNTGIGLGALNGSLFGSYNTGVGFNAGGFYENYNNTFIGAYAAPTTDGITNSIAIGYQSSVNTSNTVHIGNSSITKIGGYADWSNISDGRFKKNIKEDVPGLSFINKLKPVTYNLDVSGLRKFLGEDVVVDKDSKKKTVITPDEKTKQSIQKKEAEIQTGFVAQEVEKAANELGYKFSGVDKPENENAPYALRYAEFVVPLVKAVQELSNQNDKLQSENELLKSRLDKIEAMLAANTQLQTSNATTQKLLSNSSSLQQNVPNPFAGSTTINYSLPSNCSNAKIIITDNSGKTMKSISITGNNNGSIKVDAGLLTSGNYKYSLYANGKLIETKQMVISK